MKQPIHLVENGKERIVEGVFYFASAEPKEKVFVLVYAEDKMQITAYLTLEQVLTELVKGLMSIEDAKHG